MKILHTSDWHLGKKLLNGKSRLSEQADVLNEICDICDERQIDLVLIAGDVFDTFVPTAEAEELFFNTLNRLASDKRAVVAISGNHDDSVRLCASKVLASKSNVYMFGGEYAPNTSEHSVCTEITGKYHCVIKKGDERLYVGVLPYPSEQRFGEKRNELSFDEKMQSWINACFENNTENLPQILLSHIFMLGGTRSDSERQIDLGGTRLVDKKLIPKNCIYTALGHLHKRQIIDSERNILYSGSILQYSFDEVNCEKSVTVFQTLNGTVQNLETVPLKGGKQLAKLTALNVEAAKELLEQYKNYYCFLTLKSNDLSESESRELTSGYPQLTEFKLERCKSDGEVARADRRELDDEQAFVEYYKTRFNGELPPNELLQLYLELMGDVK